MSKTTVKRIVGGYLLTDYCENDLKLEKVFKLGEEDKLMKDMLDFMFGELTHYGDKMEFYISCEIFPFDCGEDAERNAYINDEIFFEEDISICHD